MGYATQEQAAAIFDALRERDEERQQRLPDTISALDQASVAKQRLNSLGWRDGIYCPKDGTPFALIEWGSTGVHSAHYMGKWPDGHIYCGDFLVHPQAVMWKAISDLTKDEANALAVIDASAKAFMERQFQSFSTQGEVQ